MYSRHADESNVKLTYLRSTRAIPAAVFSSRVAVPAGGGPGGTGDGERMQGGLCSSQCLPALAILLAQQPAAPPGRLPQPGPSQAPHCLSQQVLRSITPVSHEGSAPKGPGVNCGVGGARTGRGMVCPQSRGWVSLTLWRRRGSGGAREKRLSRGANGRWPYAFRTRRRGRG